MYERKNLLCKIEIKIIKICSAYIFYTLKFKYSLYIVFILGSMIYQQVF